MPERERLPWQEELTEEQLETFLGLRDDNPDELIAVLREDTEFLAAVARADTRPHLVTWFSESPETGWAHEPERSGALGESAAGVEWHWDGKDDGVGREQRARRRADGEVSDPGQSPPVFERLAATGRDVTVRGFTLLSVEEGEFTVRRFIDWAGLFAQLGLSVNWRAPV